MRQVLGSTAERLGFQLGLFLSSLILAVAALYGGASLMGRASQERIDADLPSGNAAASPVDPGALDISAPGGATIVARNIAFNARSIRAGRGAGVRLVLANQDPGVLHNVAFYTSRAATTPIFVGSIFAGPRVEEYSFVASAAPGTYFFRCDVHPDQMTGRFIVE